MCGRVLATLSSVSSVKLMTVLWSRIRGKSEPTSCSVFSMDWNACIKVPSIETTSPPPYQDLVLEKRVLAEDSRKFGVKFSTFCKKLNIYSYTCLDIRTITRV